MLHCGERCDFSNLPKQSCSHCKNLKRKQYGLRESAFNGYPVIEVLKDGGPIHSHDEHFQFGVDKAILMLACAHAIQEFVDLGDAAVEAFSKRAITTPGGEIHASVELYPDFVYSSGETIDRPWLRLEYLSGKHIGLGYEKAKAILAVQSELLTWLKRQLAPPRS
jgi:hypothetical protein